MRKLVTVRGIDRVKKVVDGVEVTGRSAQVGIHPASAVPEIFEETMMLAHDHDGFTAEDCAQIRDADFARRLGVTEAAGNQSGGFAMRSDTGRFGSLLAGVAVTVLVAFAEGAQGAEPSAAGEPPGRAAAASLATPFVSITPVYQGGADLEGGGDVRSGGLVFRAGVLADLGGGTRAGITLIYDYLDYSFSTPTAFGSNAPWGVVQRTGVVAPVSFTLGNGWTLAASPSFEWFKENGAGSADSFTWGATFSGSRRFESGNTLGLGVAVFDRLEETLVFPFLTVDWRLGDRWRLVNPLASGPTGPAGLELEFEIDGSRTAGLGAAWRTLRFRLSESGPIPSGIGEESGMPVFLRFTQRLGHRSALHLFGGIVLNGQLRIEDSSGRVLREVDRDPAPLLGATFITRF